MVKKIVKIFVIIVAIIILLNILLVIAFSIPRVQNYAADIAIEKLKPRLGTEIALDRIRIRLFNSVQINGLYVENQQQDTLLFVDELVVRFRLMDFFSNKVTLDMVEMDDFVANVHRATPDAPFSFQFIIDAFAKTDTVKVEKEKKAPWHIAVSDLRLKNGHLRYNVLSQPRTPGRFNPEHLDVQDFNFRGKVDFLDVGDMRFDVKKMSLHEHSGFSISNFDGRVMAENTLLTSNRVNLTLNNSDLHVTNARFDTETKQFALTAKSKTISPRDVAIFVPGFAHIDKPFSFEVDVEGQLPEVSLTRLLASYGNDTRVEISGLISDYGKFADSNLDVNIRTLSVSQADLQALIRIAAPQYQSPEQLLALGNLNLQLRAHGKLGNFRYQGTAETEQGNVSLSGTGKADEKFSNISLSGPVNTSDIRVANIIGESAGVDHAMLTADMDFQFRENDDITVAANGNVQSVTYKGYPYANLHFDFVYSGSSIAANVKTDSELNKLDLFADMDFGTQKKMAVKGVIDRLDLRPFIQRKNWEMPSLTARINGSLAGNTFDDMVGTLVIDSTSLSDVNFIYNPGAIHLQALADEGAGKKMQIYSSFFEGEVTGDYYFTTIGTELMHTLHPHLPSVIKEPQKARDETGKNNFQFNFSIQNTEDISYAFSLPFYNIEPATISGSVDMVDAQTIALNGYIPRLMYGSNDIRETKIDLTATQPVGIRINANTYLVQNSGYINARLNTAAAADSIQNRISFDVQNSVAKSGGELQIGMAFLRDLHDNMGADIRLHPTTVLFNGTNVDFNDAAITYRQDSIAIRNFGIREQDMLLLGIEGVASRNPADNVRVYFNNTEAENILAAFNLQNYKGSLNGAVYVSQALENPVIRTENLRIENITLYSDTIGTLRIRADWDSVDKGINLNTFLANGGEHNLSIKGFVPTGQESERAMDVEMKISDFALGSIQPLATSVFSELSGRLNSEVHITGQLSQPVMQGWLGIDEGVMKVAYTNVTYRVSDTIRIESGKIGTNNFTILDDAGNKATLSVSLSHANFGRMVYSANLSMDNFMLLNNPNRTDLMAYGQLKLSGDLSITGSPAGIFGDGRLSNRSRSKVTIVIPQTATTEEYGGVVYINTPEQSDSLSFLRRRDDVVSSSGQNAKAPTGTPISIRGIMNLTPMLELGVVLNPTTGDAIEVTGNGEVSVAFNSRATPSVSVVGDYEIDDGNFKYRLVPLRTVDFDIRKGSTLTMIGDPLNTQFNIIAYNRVNADLATLSQTFRNELANTRIPVDAVLEVRGNLERMNLAYNIELPEATNDIRQRVNSLISTDEARIRQFGSLVALGNFYASEGFSNLGIRTEMFTSVGASLLSSGLDALFANVLNDNWQIGTMLESRDGTLDNARMGVNISGRLLNDRLRVTGNFSYGDNTLRASQQDFMTEFQAMWDINNWLMLRAYNQANDRFYRRAPYTQGVGVVITKEAETLYELFRFNLGRKGGDDKE